jgi:hypothetical protein
MGPVIQKAMCVCVRICVYVYIAKLWVPEAIYIYYIYIHSTHTHTHTHTHRGHERIGAVIHETITENLRDTVEPQYPLASKTSRWTRLKE